MSSRRSRKSLGTDAEETVNIEDSRSASKKAPQAPDTPTRRSARLRGAGVEYTPDHLELLEKRSRLSRSRSTTPNTRATPRKGKEQTGGAPGSEGLAAIVEEDRSGLSSRQINFNASEGDEADVSQEAEDEGAGVENALLGSKPRRSKRRSIGSELDEELETTEAAVHPSEDNVSEALELPPSPIAEATGNSGVPITVAAAAKPVDEESPKQRMGAKQKSKESKPVDGGEVEGREEARKRKSREPIATTNVMESVGADEHDGSGEDSSSEEGNEEDAHPIPTDSQKRKTREMESTEVDQLAEKGSSKKSRKRKANREKEEEEEEEIEDEEEVRNKRKRFKQSEIDDQFFNLDEMNQFCDEEERREEKARKLGDFKGAEELSEAIQRYEEENLQPRSWELAGEVTANERGKDELLEEYVEVDYRSKTAPTITAEHTTRLEAIIAQRVRDKAFDDVVRKVRQDESLVTSYRNKVHVDVEQGARKSLAELYEDKFQDVQTGDGGGGGDGVELTTEAYIDPTTEAVDKDMKKLFVKLDALSHFQFKPMEIKPELKIVSNMASMRVEEVGPLASTSVDSHLLAPAEVFTVKKGPLKAKDERTETDKKRERRKKKKKQRDMAARGLLGGKKTPTGNEPSTSTAEKKKEEKKSKKRRESRSGRDETMSSGFEFNTSA